jgi:uncharacterized membrane protein
MILYIYLSIIILMTSINPYIKKEITKKIDKYTFIAITSLFVFFINIAYLYNNNFEIKNIYKIDQKNIINCFIVSLFSIVPSLLYLNLIQKNDISYLNPILKPIGLLVTSLIGIYYFNEKIKKNEIIGGVLILIGMNIFLKK